jgi:predicted nucleotide-binding protein (sugar kinase/HSP70/actin superfamily)
MFSKSLVFFIKAFLSLRKSLHFFKNEFKKHQNFLNCPILMKIILEINQKSVTSIDEGNITLKQPQFH